MSIYHHPRIVTDGLVLHLDAANKKSYPGSGTVWYDLSKDKRSGILTNSPVFSSNFTGAIDFIRSDNEYVSVGALSGSFASFTVDVWFYPTSISNYENVLDCNYAYNGTTGNLGPRLEIDSTGKLSWGYSNITNNNNSVYAHSVINSGLQANKWHHAAITYNGGSNSSVTYYNGINTNLSRTTAGSPTGFLGTMNNLRIGQGFSLASYTQRGYDGKIAIVKIYNKALSANEILQNFNATKSRYGL